jgi:hypothetical protein
VASSSIPASPTIQSWQTAVVSRFKKTTVISMD